MSVQPSTWTLQSGTYYQQVAMDETGQFRVAIVYQSGGDNTVVYSRDFGVTWTASTGITGDATTISMNPYGNIVMVGAVNISSSPVYISTDYGTTFTGTNPLSGFWTFVGVEYNNYMIACDYVGDVSTVYLSQNQGTSWTSIASYSGYFIGRAAWSYDDGMAKIYTVGYHTSSPYVTSLNVTADRGTTWTTLTSISSYNLGGVACDSTGQYVVVSALQDGVYRSSDYGVTWTKTSAPSSEPDGPNMGYIACDQTGDHIVVIDNVNYMVYASSDAGQTWTLQTTTGSNGAWDVLSLSMNLNGSYRYVSFLGVGTYSLIVPAYKTVNFTNGSYNPLSFITCDSTCDNIVAVGSTTYGNNKCIVYSSDNGLTWNLSDADASGDSVYTCLAASASGQYVVAGFENGPSGVVYSNDYGVNFTIVTTGLNFIPSAIAISNDGSRFYATVHDGSGAIYVGTVSGEVVAKNLGVSGMFWKSIACDSTGQYVYATAQDDYAPYYVYQSEFAIPYVHLPLNGSTVDVMEHSTVNVTGSISYVAGVSSQYAMNLVNNPAGGVPSNYVSGTTSITDDFTASCYFNVQSYPVTGQSVVFSLGDSSNSCFYLTIQQNGTGSIQMYANNSSYPTISLGSITLDTWYSVLTTFTPSGQCFAYLNGVLVGSVFSPPLYVTPSLFSLSSYTSSPGGSFNGYINDLRIFTMVGNYGIWTQIPQFASSPLLPLSITCDSTGDVVTVAAGTDGVYQSVNGGSTWDLKSVLTQSGVTVNPLKAGLSTNTWVQDGINWTSSASTNQNGQDPFVPFKEGSIDNSWNTTSNTYSTSGNNSGIYTTFYTNGSSTQTVQGDWLQIKSSNPLVMKSYQLGCGNSNNLSSRFYIIGSNDGVTWRALQYAEAPGRPSYGVYEVIPGTIIVHSTSSQTWGATTLSTISYDGSANSYTYFRLIIMNSYYGPGTVGQLGKWIIDAIPYDATIQPQHNGILSDSWSNHGVDWTASASSVNGSWSVYKAFNTTIGDAWLSSNGPSPYYDNGTVNTGVAGSTTVLGGIGVLHGEWLQIQSSVPKVLSSFSLGLGPNPWPYACAPATYYIIGSTDGATWYPIQSGTFSISNFSAASTDITINYTGTQALGDGMPGSVVTTAYASSTNAYTYFRLIGTSIMNYAGSGSTYMEIGEWYMNFLSNTTHGSCISYIELPLMSSVDDIKGNSTVTANGSITYVSGEVGTYAALLSNTAGSSPSNYIIGTMPTFTDFTISGWIKLQSIPGSGSVSAIVTLGTDSNTFVVVSYYNDVTINSTLYNGLVFSFVTSGGASVIVGNFPNVTLGTWYNFTYVFSTTGMCSAYVNHASVGSAAGDTLYANMTRYAIGSACHTAAQAFNGLISELRIYGVALPPHTGRTLLKVASDSSGENLLVVDHNHDTAFRSSDSGASWASQIIDGTGTNEIKCISIDSSGTYAFASYYNTGAFMSQRSSGLTTSWTVRNGTYYPVMTFSDDNVYQTAISALYGFTSTNHSVISYSTDSGSTWTQGPDMNGRVTGLAANATGQYVVAVLEMDLSALPSVYRSTDYGVTFTELSNSPDYQQTGINCITCDSTGQYLYAGAYDGNIYVSSNAGVDWATRTMPDYVSNIICSHSGQYVYALVNGQVCISTNHGQTWSAPIDISLNGCSQIACDWTGQYVVAACYNDGVYRSTNYGQTWTQTSAPSTPSVGGAQAYYYIACNSTGNRIITFDINNGTTYVSTNAGATWTLQYTPDSRSNEAFMGVAISPDGTRYTAAPWVPGTYSLTAGSPDIPNAIPCFLEGTKILCQIAGVETYVNVEIIRPGTLVKTSRDGYKAVKLIGHRDMTNPGTADRNKNSLYVCTKDAYPEITEDLTITGCHAILVDKITDAQRTGIISTLQRVFVTDKKYRLPTCVDERAAVVQTAGTFTVWHFALDHYDTRMNYGVYAQGLLVESSPILHMNTKNYNLAF